MLPTMCTVSDSHRGVALWCGEQESVPPRALRCPITWEHPVHRSSTAPLVLPARSARRASRPALRQSPAAAFPASPAASLGWRSPLRPFRRRPPWVRNLLALWLCQATGRHRGERRGPGTAVFPQEFNEGRSGLEWRRGRCSLCCPIFSSCGAMERVAGDEGT
jgi:hypothetical protein